jgi:exodeoxyribonuclease VII large subunit
MHTQRVDYCQARLAQLLNKNIQTKKLRLSALSSTLLGLNPNHIINDYQKRFSAVQHRLFTLIQQQLHNYKIRFVQCSKGLETLSPLATLARGYSLTQLSTDGSIIKSTRQVNLGDKLNIQLSDGSLQACLEGINEDT